MNRFFNCTQTCAHMHTQIYEEAMNLQKNKERYVEQFGERKQKGELKQLYYNLKNTYPSMKDHP